MESVGNSDGAMVQEPPALGFEPRRCGRSNELSEEVAEVENLIEKVNVVRTRRIPFENRNLAIGYIGRYHRLEREATCFLTSKNTLPDLKKEGGREVARFLCHNRSKGRTTKG